MPRGRTKYEVPRLETFSKIGAGHGCFWFNAMKDVVEEKQRVVKIAGFDMDDTLITHVYPNNTSPQNEHDWIWITEDVLDHLKDLTVDGYQILVFSSFPNILNIQMT